MKVFDRLETVLCPEFFTACVKVFCACGVRATPSSKVSSDSFRDVSVFSSLSRSVSKDFMVNSMLEFLS